MPWTTASKLLTATARSAQVRMRNVNESKWSCRRVFTAGRLLCTVLLQRRGLTKKGKVTCSWRKLTPHAECAGRLTCRLLHPAPLLTCQQPVREGKHSVRRVPRT